MTFEDAMTALEGKRFIHARADMTDEEHAAASEHNIGLLSGFRAAQDAWLARYEAAFPDRSTGAIWRRAYKRSITADRAESSRRWKARALNLDPTPHHNAIALSGMAPLQIDDVWHLAIAIPQPAPRGDLGFAIEDVVVIDPKNNTASILGDRGATHVGPPIGMVDRLPVMTDPKAWARRIALERLEWWHQRRDRRRMMQSEPVWNGWPTAALLLVEPKKMRWRDLSAGVLEVPADMRETVRRAVIAEARLPKIECRA